MNWKFWEKKPKQKSYNVLVEIHRYGVLGCPIFVDKFEMRTRATDADVIKNHAKVVGIMNDEARRMGGTHSYTFNIGVTVLGESSD